MLQINKTFYATKLTACGSSKSSKSSDKDGDNCWGMNLSDMQKVERSAKKLMMQKQTSNIHSVYRLLTNPNCCSWWWCGQCFPTLQIILKNWEQRNNAAGRYYIAPIRIYLGTKMERTNTLLDRKRHSWKKGTIAAQRPNKLKARLVAWLESAGLIAGYKDRYHQQQSTINELTLLKRHFHQLDGSSITLCSEAGIDWSKKAFAEKAKFEKQWYNLLQLRKIGKSSDKAKAIEGYQKSPYWHVKKVIEESSDQPVW